MRKITTAIFLLIACIHNSWSDTNDLYTDCKYNDAETACLEYPGCYIESGTCTPCASGTYRDSTDNTATTCTSCEATINIQKIDRSISKNTTLETTDDDNTYTYIKTGATSPNGCAVKIQCPAGTGIYYNTDDGDSVSCKTCAYITNPSADSTSYVLNDNYFSNESTSVEITDWRELKTGVIFNYEDCHACPDNSKVDDTHTSCTCNAGYHNDNSEGQTDADKNKDRDIKDPNHKCTENKYPVTVYNDCDVESPTVASPTDKCKGTVAYKNPLSVAISSCSPEKTGYHLENDNLNLYKKQDTNDTIITTDEINDIDPGTKYELCPIWTANTFYIQYEEGTTAENVTIKNIPSQQTCTYSEPCEISSTIPTADKGYVFMGWQITSYNHTDSFNKKTKYQPKSVFTNATTINGATIVLSAQWVLCPAGYYACENNSGTLIGCKCPAGSTSAPGATSKKNCFINNDTQFCDTNGQSCFKLNICTQIDGVWENCPGHTDDTSTCSGKQEINVSAQQ